MIVKQLVKHHRRLEVVGEAAETRAGSATRPRAEVTSNKEEKQTKGLKRQDQTKAESSHRAKDSVGG